MNYHPAPDNFLAIRVPTSLRLTARLEESDKVQVFPLSTTPAKLPPEVPSLRQAKGAGTIKLKEVTSVEPLKTTSEKERKAWLRLLLRESLGPSFFQLM